MFASIGLHDSLTGVRLAREDDGSLSVWLSIGGIALGMGLAEVNQLMVALDEAREQAELLPPDAPVLSPGTSTVWRAKLMPIVPAPAAEAG